MHVHDGQGMFYLLGKMNILEKSHYLHNGERTEEDKDGREKRMLPWDFSRKIENQFQPTLIS